VIFGGPGVPPIPVFVAPRSVSSPEGAVGTFECLFCIDVCCVGTELDTTIAINKHDRRTKGYRMTNLRIEGVNPQYRKRITIPPWPDPSPNFVDRALVHPDAEGDPYCVHLARNARPYSFTRPHPV
jgi:hypothetical protein